MTPPVLSSTPGVAAAGAAEIRNNAPAESPLEPVAIVGIGCRFPGGIDDLESFWELISAGTDAIGDIPPDRWCARDFYDADPATPGRMFVRQGGFLRCPVDAFDAGFFGMSPREAAALDPQQRLLLEVTWEALEEAGIPPSSTAATAVGAYIGGFTFDSATLQLTDTNQPLISAATTTGVSLTLLAARLSYFFDWRGPSLTLDTACSSSLVALHHACGALARGDCELAVAGGVNIMVNPVTSILMSKGQFLSPDARCKSFDHRANGYARGEGAGIVVLEPVSAALRNGHPIHAIIRGTAVNQDGHTPGITVPSGQAQHALIQRACQVGGVKPSSVGYFEAHGTGTAVGDPIEAGAIGEVLGDSTETHWMGSVKSNFGHTEAAAGVAGLIKATLCLTRGLIPPNLHFEKPNPRIPFDKLPLRVPTTMVPFPEQDGRRRAGVNSFGFGGTNAHAILEQWTPPPPAEHTDDGGPVLLPLSARSPAALRSLADSYAALLAKPDVPGMARIARAAARQRDHHPLRTFVVAADPAEAARELRELDTTPKKAARRGIVFIYTGMGPQWWGMGRELLLHEPRFGEVVADCDEILARFGLCIADEFLREQAESRLTRTLYAQVGNFVLQAGLTAMWRDWGIEPSIVIGASVGEVSATYAAGVYCLEDALTISFRRANLQATLAGQGSMAVVDRTVDDIEPHLVDGVSIAAINSPHAITLAGDHQGMARVTETLTAAGATVTRLRTEVAYHSYQMDAVREPLLAALRDIRPKPAQVTLVSSVTGEQVEGSELDAHYWWSNVRQPVLFEAALRRALVESPGAVLEVGPHPVLASATDEVLSGHEGVTRLMSLRRDRPQRQQMLETLGQLYQVGVDPAWERMHPGDLEHLEIPLYPWQRERYWVESAASQRRRLGESDLLLRGRTIVAPTPIREVELSLSKVSYLVDHKVDGVIVFPGSGYLETALAAFPDDEPCLFQDIVFHRPLVLAAASVTTVRAGYDPTRRLLSLHAHPDSDEGDWTLHAELNRAHFAKPRLPAPYPETPTALVVGLPEFDHHGVYQRLTEAGLDYGPAFRAVQRLWWRQQTREVFAELRLDTVEQTGHRLHPVLLDAALQAVIVGGYLFGGEAFAGTYVPSRIEAFEFFRSPGTRMWVHGRSRDNTAPGLIECDLTLVTDQGEVVAGVRGLQATRLARTEQRPRAIAYQHTWERENLEPATTFDGTWIVVGRSAIATRVVRRLSELEAETVHMDTADDGWLEQVLTAVAHTPEYRGVVYFDNGDTNATPTGPVCAPVAAPLQLAQQLPRGPLFLVTEGAQSVSDDDPTSDPSAASLWGFGRVVAAERPELPCRLIDLDPTQFGQANGPVDALLSELAHQHLDEVALRANGRYVRRLQPAGPGSSLDHVTTRTHTTPVRLQPHRVDGSGLGFVATTRRPPGPGEIEIEVSYVGLNFKDVLKHTGLIASYAIAIEGAGASEIFGLECSGTIVRVGAGVSDVAVGDKVFAHYRDLFVSYTTIEARRAVRIPEPLSEAQAASLLPVVTAYYSLVRLAGLRRGERVLIHSGAGGVGLAAARIATWLGAEVFLTAGSPQRREFLRREGFTRIADSRSASFADDVLEWTGGAGVEVVVNSLPGEMITHSLRALRTFGRFIELGKPGDVADHAVRLASSQRALSFHTVDYSQLIALAPEQVQVLMRESAELCAQGTIAPLPVTEVPAGEADRAFRVMAGPEHRGKIVVRMAGETVTVPASSLEQSPIRPDGTYVITGGLGGLGRTVARWMASQGARHLMLVGRGGIATDEAARLVADLSDQGVAVRVEKVDVGEADDVHSLFTHLRAAAPPIKGIVHGAADFDDVMLTATDADRLVGSTRPKADGAWHLHQATLADELDFFVLFSSVAAQLGAAGAGGYASANEYLNGLARYRRGRGLPATSIGWGMIEQVGVAVSRDGHVGNVLKRTGHRGISPQRLVTELATVLHTRPTELSLADIDWPYWSRKNPQLAALPRFSAVVAAGSREINEGSVPERLRQATPTEQATLVPTLVTPLLQQITGLTGQQLAEAQAIDIDSLMAVELRVLLHKHLGISVPAMRLQRNLNVEVLSDLLLTELAHTDDSSAVSVTETLTTYEITCADGLVCYGHLSLPTGPGPHPAVVVCPPAAGGALDAEGNYAHISEHAPLRAAGFAVFTVDRRGAPGHGVEYRTPRAFLDSDSDIDDADDTVAATDYLAALPDIDAERISILGTSRGAFTALLALERHPGLWLSGVLLMGVYDLAALDITEPLRALLPEHHDQTALEAHFTAPQRQPLRHLTAITAPLLLVHGDADRLVPLDQSLDLIERLRRADLPARLITVPGLAHDSEHAAAVWDELWPQIIRFLATDSE